jgi:hypothetical protein
MAWGQIATLTGPQGPTGAQGVQGDTGAQGIQGAQGPAGTTTIRGATDYDNAVAPTDRQAILWVAAGSKFVPQTIQLADVSGLVSGLAGKAPLASPAFTGTPTGITAAHVGLGNVNNTADSAKPVSAAQQTALDLKAPLASPAFTGTPTGLTKTHVGLSNVTNTADSAKPVSTAQLASDLAVFNSIRVLSGFATSDHTITQSTADIGGATVTFTTFTANAIAEVTCNFDFRLTVLGTGYCYGEFAVDGSTHAKKALFVYQSVETRAPGSFTIPVTLVSTGSHTIKLQTHKDAATGTGTAYMTGGSVTGIIVTVYDRNF